jgi:cobalt-zinc-cadmium efflux system membrane fusion protein
MANQKRIQIAMIASLLCTACNPYEAEPPSPSSPVAPMEEVWLKPADAKRARIRAQPIGLFDLEQFIYTSGRVTFVDVQVAHIFSPVSGRITQIFAPLGENVKKDDPLALVVSPDIGIASSDVSKAQADLIAAEHNFQRQKRLFTNHAASELDLEAAEDNFRRAQAEFDRAKQRMLLLHGGSSNVSQGYMLRSPIPGEVLMRGATPGVEVSGQYQVGGSVELFTIGTLDQVWVLADLYEIDLARVVAGAKVTVSVVSYPERVFTGKVDWVSGMLDPVQRTARVRCVFQNPDHALRPEMYATVQISTAAKHALAVPRQALFRVGEQTFVFIERPQTPDGLLRFARVPVVANEGQAAGLSEVQRGLSSGQRVVTEGIQQLRSLLDNTMPRGRS